MPNLVSQKNKIPLKGIIKINYHHEFKKGNSKSTFELAIITPPQATEDTLFQYKSLIINSGKLMLRL